MVFLRVEIRKVDLLQETAQQEQLCVVAIHATQLLDLRHRALVSLLVEIGHKVPQLVVDGKRERNHV